MRVRRTTLVILSLFCASNARGQHRETIREVLPRVALVTALDEKRKPLAVGSGFVIDAEGRIASNLHVIVGASSATVRFVGLETSHSVSTVSAFSTDRDLVILRTAARAAPLELGDSAGLEAGDKVLAFGNPRGLEGTVTDGIVSAVRTVSGGIRLIQISAPISPGSSGGPVTNGEGKVVGIASASLLGAQNLNFAIPVEYLKELIKGGFREMPMSDLRRLAEPTTKARVLGRSSGRVKALDFHCKSLSVDPSGEEVSDIRFSLQNNLDRDLRDVRVLVVWMKGSEKLAYSAYLVQEIVPAQQAIQVKKMDKGGISRFLWEAGFSYEVRVLDYEILASNQELPFR